MKTKKFKAGIVVTNSVGNIDSTTNMVHDSYFNYEHFRTRQEWVDYFEQHKDRPEFQQALEIFNSPLYKAMNEKEE